MPSKAFAWTRQKTYFGGQLATLRLFGKEFEFHWQRDYKVRGNRRAFFSLGWGKGNDHYGILFQHYREGFDFASHTDGPKSNHVVTLVLHRPRRGGEFFCKGPTRCWLNSRVIAFNGADEHGVTKIEQGSRTVLMFQHGQWK